MHKNTEHGIFTKQSPSFVRKIGTEPTLSNVRPMWFGVNGPLNIQIPNKIIFSGKRLKMTNVIKNLMAIVS